MSRKERIRLEAFARVKGGTWTVVRAAQACRLSVRQARRVWKRYMDQQDAGLLHAGRGRRSNRRIDDALRRKIVARYLERYPDFGPTHACEKLAAEGLVVSADTLTTLLKEAGKWEPRRKRDKHRSRRERRSCFGALVQMDGSPHDWFEGRCEPCCLMVAVDDATGRTLARFYPRETAEAAFDLFGRWVRRHGVPRALYVDRAGIYRADREAVGEEVLAGVTPRTHFGEAMARLGVELILANSPQAKGRVERKNRVLQDRLIKEMRLSGIDSMEAGNAFLEAGFLTGHNQTYGVVPREDSDDHRELEIGLCLEEVLCMSERRVVSRDWCVRCGNRWLQIDKQHASLYLPGKEVVVRERADGKLVVEYNDVKLECREIPPRPTPTRAKEKKPVKNNKEYKPPATHP